jgi:hypothetical protein
MEWEELVANFRELGGIAENVRLGHGALGRGLFVCDTDKPAAIHASENLLFRVADVDLRDGQLRLKQQANVGERERRFFDAYERYFGWGAGGLEESWSLQKQWNELPADVVAFLKTMGGLDDPDKRFLPPSLDSSFDLFVEARRFGFGDDAKIVPIVDLINYSSYTNGFNVGNGIGVSGRFPNEVVVRYNLGDAWGRAMAYGFACVGAFAYSLSLTADVPGGKKVAIRRDVAASEVRYGVRFHRASISGDTLSMPFLMLGNATGSDLPRAVFRSIASGFLTEAQADGAFDGLANFNRTQFLKLLRILRKHDGAFVRMLEDAVIDQLVTLSFCVGARTLTPIAFNAPEAAAIPEL